MSRTSSEDESVCFLTAFDFTQTNTAPPLLHEQQRFEKERNEQLERDLVSNGGDSNAPVTTENECRSADIDEHLTQNNFIQDVSGLGLVRYQNYL